MNEPGPRYQKFSRLTKAWLKTFRLWLAADHIMEASSLFGVERYRRIYFREVEALIIRTTGDRLTRNVVFGLGAALAIAVAWGTYSPSESANPGALVAPIAWAFFCGLCLAAVIWNSIAGEGCAFYVQTPAGLVQLRSLRRLPVARRARERLLPLINAAQETPPHLPEFTPAAAAVGALNAAQEAYAPPGYLDAAAAPAQEAVTPSATGAEAAPENENPGGA